MAKQSVESPEMEVLGEVAISKTEQFFENNGKKVAIAIFSLLAVAAVLFSYKALVMDPAEARAYDAIYMAQVALESQAPDYTAALEGSESNLGFLEVIENFGSTKAGNTANHYAGICYLKLGDKANAKRYLAAYKAQKGIPAMVINAQNIGLQGDIAVDEGNYTEAIALYLQKYIVYRKRKIFFGKSTTSDLMTVIMKHKEEKFILALSEPHSEEIPKLLTNAKLKFEKLILAKSIANLEVGTKSELSSYDMFALYSRHDVATLVERFGPTVGQSPIAAFGAATAAAAIEANLNVQILAPTKESPSMVMAIDKYMQTIASGKSVDTSYIAEHIKSAMQAKDQLIAKIKPARTRKSTTKSCSTTTTTTKKRCTKSSSSAVKQAEQ